jgi:hypothetical protein
MKWADFCISKLSFAEPKRISDVIVHKDNDDTVGVGQIRDRNWLVQQVNLGKSFCCITRQNKGLWSKVCDMDYNNGFKWSTTLPQVLTKRKTFICYYHNDDEKYRDAFDNVFDDLVVSKSVEKDDIDSDNSDEYIKQLIQKEYLHDTTVLVVLIGPKTKCRKHIDWEISGALNHKVGDQYSGLLGLFLPTHQDFGNDKYTPNLIPERLYKNAESGYAVLRDWTTDRVKLQEYIELAFAKRKNSSKITNKAIPQMQANTCQ